MEDRPAASPSYKGGSLDSAFRRAHSFNLHGDQPQPAMEQTHDHGIPPERQIGQLAQPIGIDWWYVTVVPSSLLPPAGSQTIFVGPQ